MGRCIPCMVQAGVSLQPSTMYGRHAEQGLETCVCAMTRAGDEILCGCVGARTAVLRGPRPLRTARASSSVAAPSLLAVGKKRGPIQPKDEKKRSLCPGSKLWLL